LFAGRLFLPNEVDLDAAAGRAFPESTIIDVDMIGGPVATFDVFSFDFADVRLDAGDVFAVDVRIWCSPSLEELL
jgi:hypothetical protein